MLTGLRKQVGLAVVQVLNSAFAATTNPDGTSTGHWTDDGGYSRTLTIRGAWSTEPAAYPLLTVRARRGTLTPPAGFTLKATSLQAGQVDAPVAGGIIDDWAIRVLLSSASEDECEQLADLVDQAFYCGVSSAGVRYSDMLKNRGVSLKAAPPETLSQARQGDDPAHGPLVYQAALTYGARTQVLYVPTLSAVQTVTYTLAIAVPVYTPATVTA